MALRFKLLEFKSLLPLIHLVIFDQLFYISTPVFQYEKWINTCKAIRIGVWNRECSKSVIFILTTFTFLCVSTCAHICLYSKRVVVRGHILRSHLSASTMWVPGIELRSTSLVAITITWWAILQAPSFGIFRSTYLLKN